MEALKQLFEEKQYSLLRETLSDMNEADVAAFMDTMPKEELLRMFRILPKDMAADVFADLELDNQQHIIQSLSDKEAGLVIDNLMADDATDLLEEMPAGVVKRLLANAKPETRADINHLLRYPEDSAGSIMTVEYIGLKEHMTVADAIERVRQGGLDTETINTCYVLDERRKLTGTVALRYLLLHKPEDVIGDFMNTNVISISTTTDQEEAARQFQKYDFTVMPVVDTENRMVGIITIDDVVDILQEEATEDIEKMAAILPTDKPYFRVGIFETYRKRMPWLLLLMISATFTGAIIMRFEEALSAVVVLTVYIPMLMDTAGNAGGQASVSIIRGLSLGEIRFEDLFKTMFKEFRVSILCGVTLASANFIKLLVVDRIDISVAFVVCFTLVIVVICAKLVGCTLPLLAKKIGFDPAVMASPMVTTIVDAISLLVYFTIATSLLHLAV
ncbi:MAG: magnesium transporter [Lachnospiraceae bacterium]|nr:magnesium transporter [Lachnospiraceae bacterium]